MGQKVFSSAINWAAVTPSDSTTISCKALYVGTSGNIALKQGSGASAVTFIAVPVGFFPIELKDGLVMSTNTTASNIVKVDW